MHEHFPKFYAHDELITVLKVLAAILEAPQNRFGKLEFYTEEARAARNALLDLAREYKITPSHTIVEQAAKVARAALAKVSQ